MSLLEVEEIVACACGLGISLLDACILIGDVYKNSKGRARRMHATFCGIRKPQLLDVLWWSTFNSSWINVLLNIYFTATPLITSTSAILIIF